MNKISRKPAHTVAELASALVSTTRKLAENHAWREFPCFHADLPGFSFLFVCATSSSLSPAWAEKNCFFFNSPNAVFSAKKNVFLRGNGVLRRVLHTPPVGPWCCRYFIPRRRKLRQNQTGLPDPNPKPTPAWLGGWVRSVTSR